MNEKVSTPRTFDEHLQYQMWVTKGTRFNADRRLRLESEWSQRSIALLSVYLVILSIAVVVPAFGISTTHQTEVSIVTAALSLLLVVLSLLENGRNYLVRADRLHRCAMSIDSLLSDVRAELPLSTGPAPSAHMLELSQKYHEVLAGCAENHSEVDFDLFRATHASDFGLHGPRALVLRLWCWVRPYWFKSSAGIAPIVVAVWYVASRR